MLTVSSEFSIPRGFRFLPTKEEIFLYYLKPAINGEPLSANVLIEEEIYGENREPWNIFDKDAKNSFWVFTKLKKKSKARIDRVAGCGCWLGRSIREVKDASGKLLGFDKYFTFTCKKNQSSQGHWIMHEFSLSEEGLNDFVICEIKNKDVAVGLDHQEDEVKSKNQKRKTLEVNDEDISVRTTKKVCADQRQSSLNKTNADEWYPSSGMISYQHHYRELDQQETYNPNTVHTMISTSSPDFTNAYVCVGPEEEMSLTTMKTFGADQSSINQSIAQTICKQKSGELDHQETHGPNTVQTMISSSPPGFNNASVYVDPKEEIWFPTMKKFGADQSILNESNGHEWNESSPQTICQQNFRELDHQETHNPKTVQAMINTSCSPDFTNDSVYNGPEEVMSFLTVKKFGADQSSLTEDNADEWNEGSAQTICQQNSRELDHQETHNPKTVQTMINTSFSPGFTNASVKNGPEELRQEYFEPYQDLDAFMIGLDDLGFWTTVEEELT